MKFYGYINGVRTQLDDVAVEVELNRDNSEDDAVLNDWGGKTLVRITTTWRGKKGHSFVSARVSGDSRAGSMDGVHLRLSTSKRDKDVGKSVHVVPWIKKDEV